MSGVLEAWAAGFFEGEGSIAIRSHRKRGGIEYSLCCSVNQVGAEALEDLRARFGGSLVSITKANVVV